MKVTSETTFREVFDHLGIHYNEKDMAEIEAFMDEPVNISDHPIEELSDLYIGDPPPLAHDPRCMCVDCVAAAHEHEACCCEDCYQKLINGAFQR